MSEQNKQEPVTILPDGSAFGVMSFPLPDDHWLYAPNEYRDGEYEPIDLPKPILTHALREAVVAAIRYAVRGATMRGQETDFDPDALVQNAVYALCGPYTTPPAAPVQEPVAWRNAAIRLGEELSSVGPDDYYNMTAEQWLDWALGQQPRGKNSLSHPHREWVGLTDEEIYQIGLDTPIGATNFARALEAKLKEKND